ncbi:MAG: hypothetical protein PVSMB1_05880 [Gemmatimonadaceae bacterium]
MRATPLLAPAVVTLSLGFAFALHSTATAQTMNVKQIVRQVVPRDAIPALVIPEKIAPQQATFLREGDRVIALRIAGVDVAYPTRILDHHEIVNDVVNGKPIVVTS